MTDADRLREAADRLDEWSPVDRSGAPMPPSATAALLRAVSHEDYGYSGPYRAALALASVILGAES